MSDLSDYVETFDSKFAVEVNQDHDVVLNLVSEGVGISDDGVLVDETSFAILEPLQAAILAGDLLFNAAKGVLKSLF
ncbi:hypothetical protein SEA_APIARY_65 [Rhodococcus phage Apiary]|nr:hypothetical protein SEA_POLYYUKI_65 [Rhodococcus phage Polyyuki]WNM69873.1 hypothetical protein SEA_APIARY_65 [Rhodococcus phage Apiary]